MPHLFQITSIFKREKRKLFYGCLRDEEGQKITVSEFQKLTNSFMSLF